MDPATRGTSEGFAQRLRALRTATGLSQVDLAGGDLSASYISLLEAGKRSPTSDVVKVLANRLGCGAAYLIEGADAAAGENARLALEGAELAIRNGQAPQALAALTPLMTADVLLESDLRWRARRLHARALEASGDLPQALSELEGLRTEAASTRNVSEELQLAVALIRCYHQVGDTSLAIELGESTLERLATLKLVGTADHASLVFALIGAYHARGDLTHAAMLAKSAAHDIDAVGSRWARAAAYWTSSLMTESAGDVAGALALAERAVTVLAEADERRALGRLRTVCGWLLLRLDPPEPGRALAELRKARDTLVDAGSDADLASCETEIARCALLQGKLDDALAHAGAARKHLGDAPRVEVVHAAVIEAHALLAGGRRVEAVARCRLAASIMAGVGPSRQRSVAWRELGDAYSKLGMPTDAAPAYRRALTDAGIRSAPAPPVTARTCT